MRFLRGFVIACAVFLLGMFSASPVHAMVVGTHVGYGDIGTQVRVIQKVDSELSSQGINRTYPVTVMVDIGVSSGQIQQLIDTSSANIQLFFRINGFRPNTTGAQLAATAQAFNAANPGSLNNPPIIIVGNELNNIEVEWSANPAIFTPAQAAAKYDEIFPSFMNVIDTNKYRVAPAVLDPYHPNAAVEFIGGAITSFGDSRARAFGTNVYQGVGDGLAAGERMRNYLPTGKAYYVLTEFGLNPTIKDIQQHLDFYALYDTLNPAYTASNATSFPPPAGYEYATALVPNVCDEAVRNGGEAPAGARWYFYILGDIYDENLTKLDPETCGDASEVSQFILPGPDDVYLATQDPGKLYDILTNEYAAYCSPLINWTPKLDPPDPRVPIGPRDAMVSLKQYCGDLFTAYGPNNPTYRQHCIYDVNSQSIEIDISQAEYPFTRSNVNGRTGSLEGYVSREKDADAKDLRQFSPADRLRSKQSICQDNVDFLQAIETTCTIPPELRGKLDPNQLELLEDFLASLGFGPTEERCPADVLFNGKYLTEWLNLIRAQGYSGREAQYCDSDIFVGQGGRLTATVLNQEQKDLNKALASIQPVLKNVYQKGYMIVYNHSREIEELENANILTYMAFARPDYENLITIVPFLVPKGFSSRKTDSDIRKTSGEQIDASFTGVYSRTFDSLLPRELKDKVQEDIDKKQELVSLNMAKFGGRTVKDDGMIYLPYCDGTVPYQEAGLTLDEKNLNCAFAERANASFARAQIRGEEIQEIRYPLEAAPCMYYDVGGETAETLNEPVKPDWLNALTSWWRPNRNTKVTVSGQIKVNDLNQVPEQGLGGAWMRTIILLPQSETWYMQGSEEFLFKSLVGANVRDELQAKVARGEEKMHNGFLQMLGLKINITPTAVKNYFIRESSPPEGSPDPLATPRGSNLEVKAYFGANAPSISPMIPGGYITATLNWLNGNIMAPVKSSLHDAVENYQRKTGLEKYWTSGGRSGSNQTRTLDHCPADGEFQTQVPNEDGVKSMMCSVAAQIAEDPVSKQQLAEALWGVFRIEGYTTRDKMYEGGGTVDCIVDAAGGLTPMSHILDMCRAEMGLSVPQESVFVCPESNRNYSSMRCEGTTERLNVCDLRTAFTATADCMNYFGNLASYQQNSSPNWEWIIGTCVVGSGFEEGGAYRGTDGCAIPPDHYAANVQGCNGLDYCDCAMNFVAGFDYSCQ